MNVSGSEPTPEEKDLPFVERDDEPTKMIYDHGGVPMYVAVAWVIFLACYVAYMVVYGLPDLSAWGAP